MTEKMKSVQAPINLAFDLMNKEQHRYKVNKHMGLLNRNAQNFETNVLVQEQMKQSMRDHMVDARVQESKAMDYNQEK